MKTTFRLALIIVLVGFMQACDLTDFSNPEITYDGQILAWDGSEDETFTLTVNDDVIAENLNMSSYNLGEMNSDFTVDLTVHQGEESETYSQEFHYLETIADVESDPKSGRIEWDAVEGASDYELTVNGETILLSQTYFDDFDIGYNQVSFQAVSDNSFTFSYESEIGSFHLLDQVENVEYEDNVLNWRSVSNAAAYNVIINGQIIETTNNETFNYDAQGNDFDVSIQAIDDDNSNVFDGAASEVLEYTYLSTPEDLRIQEGILKWDSVEDATAYELTIDGEQQIVQNNRFDDLVENVQQMVDVRAITDQTEFYSTPTEEETFRILEAPSIEWNPELESDGEANENIIWDTVSNANGYLVELTKPDGEIVYEELGSNQRTFADTYDKIGEYTVRLQALSDTSQSDTYNSKFGNEIVIERLEAPELPSDSISSDPQELTGFDINFEPVNGADRYTLYKEGSEILESLNSNMTVTEIADTDTFEKQELNYTLRSRGGVRQEDGQQVVTLDSLTDHSTSFTITVLETPSVDDISGYTFSWQSVSQAEGYTIDRGTSHEDISSGTEYDLRNVPTGKSTLRVTARGNGGKILPSRVSEGQSLQRLEPPKNLRIGTQESNEGTLLYDDVTNARSYTATFGADEEQIPTDELGNVSQKISTAGTPVTIRAVANYMDETQDIYYITSEASPTQQFTRLQAPSFGERPFSNTTFEWNGPGNIVADEYTPVYRVYDTNQLTFNSGVGGTSMNIEGLDAGNHTFYVRAIGDGDNYINSTLSDPVEVQKLDTVEMSIEDDQYTWDAVSGAVSYELYIDNVLQENFPHEANETYTYEPKFDEIKTYEIKIIAKGDQGISSIDSEPFLMDQETKMLSTPGFDFEYSEENYIEDATIDITVDVPSNHARGYGYVIGGSLYTSSKSEYSFNPSDSGSYTLGVYGLGGAIVDDVYYIDSQTQGLNDNYTLTILSPPSHSSIELSRDGRLSWGNVSESDNYEYIVDFHDSDETIEGTTTNTYRDLDLNDEGGFEVRIRATGATNKITSDWVEKDFNWE